MNILWYILGAAYLLSITVQNRLRANYKKWGAIRNSANMTGAETARVILDANDLRRVEIRSVQGKLSDHYDPRDQSIRLSESVFNVPSVAAMAVAAHETGHAIQHAANYTPLKIRTAMTPVVNTAASYGIPAAIFGLFMGAPLLTLIGAIAYVVALAFQFITLPIEFNASKRALAQLERLQLLNAAEKQGARSMLRAATMTYVAGVASSAAYVLYLVLLVGKLIFKTPAPLRPPRLP